MSTRLQFESQKAVSDALLYLRRAGAIEDGSVRIVADAHAGNGPGHMGPVALYTCVLRPEGLLDEEPTVMGLRVVRAALSYAELADEHDGVVDIVTPIRGFLERAARDVEQSDALEISPARRHEPWAGVLPPRSGWKPVGSIAEGELAEAADAGMAEVARAVASENRGEGMPDPVLARTSAWTRPIAHGLPAGAAFGASVLGFLAPRSASGAMPHPVGSPGTIPSGAAQVSAQPGWMRLSLQRGHILVRMRFAAD